VSTISQHTTSPRQCIDLRNVSKTYTIESQTVEALRGIDLTIPQGTLAAVVGKSGAGKSTFLHIVGTLDRPTTGDVVIHGTNVARMNDQSASRFRNAAIGFVFQMNNLLPEFTAMENVMMPGIVAGAKTDVARERAHKLLVAVGLAAREKHRPSELSGGEQQRVAIARALFMSPSILLADEPTGNLDKRTSESIKELLIGLAERRAMTMLLVTHDTELAKRIPINIVMEDGRVVDAGGLQ